MNAHTFTHAFDARVNDALLWVDDAALFDPVRTGLTSVFETSLAALMFLPWWFFVLAVLVATWLWMGRAFAIVAVLGLALCQSMGLWAETMTTLTLVLTSTVLALAVAIPAGVLIGLSRRCIQISNVVLDFIQTMPAYLYLLPGIALLGYGPATAVWATSLVAMAPAMRLTAHGIQLTPQPLHELGQALGISPWQTLWKIRVPAAFAAIMTGINQSLMLAFGMVVIAGIVGSGGLGQAVYDAVRLLQIDKSINAGIAIVVLSILLDRCSQRLARRQDGGSDD